MQTRKMIASLVKTKFDHVYFEFGTCGELYYSAYKNGVLIATIIVEE